MKPLYKQQNTLSVVDIKKTLEIFYKEDKINHDLSTICCTSKHDPLTTAQLIAEEDLIVAGLPLFDIHFQPTNILNKTNQPRKHTLQEGSVCHAGDVLYKIEAPASTLLSYERVLLNLIQRMSGIASLTNQYVQMLNSPNIKILDTRKTTPGLRLFEKYAVFIGGGYNHRFDLNEGVMIKDNHLVIIENLDSQLIKFQQKYPNKKIQIEVDNFKQLKTIVTSLSIKIDAVLLDNMNATQTEKCSKFIRKNLPQCFIESSGGINLKNITNYQSLDIDGISIGALTHQANSKNIKLEFQ